MEYVHLVADKAAITVLALRKQIVWENETIRVNCSSSEGYPPPQLQLFFNGSAISEQSVSAKVNFMTAPDFIGA